VSDRRRTREQETPPALANIEAERAVLGRLLADDRQYLDVAERIRADHFADARHQRIYRGLQSLAAQGRPMIRQLLLSEMGAESSEDDQIDLAGYLAALQAGAPDFKIPVGEFVDAVLHAAARRRGIEEAQWLIEQFQEAKLSRTLEELFAEGTRRLGAAMGDETDDARQIGEIAEAVVTDAQERWMAETPAGLKTGLTAFDDLVGSMMAGDLVVIGGLASSGKTALSVQLGILAAQAGTPVFMVSLEMEAKAVAARVLATFSQINAQSIREAELDQAKVEKLIEMGRRLRPLPFWIDARPRQTMATIQTRLARAKARNNIGLCIIDHLRYVRPDNNRAEERERLEQVVNDVAAMLKRLQIPGLLLAHQKRYIEPETIRTAKDIRRPLLTDFYGSSAIENAADVALFVHRPSWWLERISPAPKYEAEHAADLEKWRGKAELVLVKHRSAKGSGVRTCRFDEQTTWFSAINE